MKTSRRIFDSETMKAIGQRLREVRGDRTLAEFSDRLGVARTTWSNYEAGRRLPSHEVMESLRNVEGVPPDRILPNALVHRQVGPIETNDWFAFIPALWLFSKLKGVQPFANEEEELKWWASRMQSLAEEFASRAFELGDKRDLYLEDAALEVCKDLATRSPEELLAFISAAK